MNLEHDLRQALKRKEPPQGFSERVLNKIGSSDVDVLHAPTRWRRFVLPVAASLMLLAGGGFFVQQRSAHQAQEQQSQQYRQTAQAAHDVMLALQIASEKVSAVQAKVQEMTHHEPQNDF